MRGGRRRVALRVAALLVGRKPALTAGRRHLAAAIARRVTAIVGVLVAALACSAVAVWAEARVIVTREENKPATVEIRVGEEVHCVNVSGGIAHISFGDAPPVQFRVGEGSSSVKFTTAGTYRYTVHLAGVKAHAHTGTVVVK